MRTPHKLAHACKHASMQLERESNLMLLLHFGILLSLSFSLSALDGWPNPTNSPPTPLLFAYCYHSVNVIQWPKLITLRGLHCNCLSQISSCLKLLCILAYKSKNFGRNFNFTLAIQLICGITNFYVS